MTTFPLVSIVILSWNRRADLRTSLAQISKNNYPNLEIIVVDNGSTDGAPEMVTSEFPGVKLISLQKNIGIAGINEGFKEAKGEYILSLDDDSYPAPDAIEKSIPILEKDKNIAVIAFNFINTNTKKSESPDWPENVFTFMGGGAIFRKRTLEEVGYFDADFFIYCCEFELAIRILSHNSAYKMKHFTDIIGYHQLAATNLRSSRRAFYELRNSLWIIWKYFSFPRLIPLSFRRIFEEFVFIFTVYKSPVAYFKGLASAFLGLKTCLKKRKVMPWELEQAISLSSMNLLGEPILEFLLINIRSIPKKFTKSAQK